LLALLLFPALPSRSLCPPVAWCPCAASPLRAGIRTSCLGAAIRLSRTSSLCLCLCLCLSLTLSLSLCPCPCPCLSGLPSIHLLVRALSRVDNGFEARRDNPQHHHHRPRCWLRSTATGKSRSRLWHASPAQLQLQPQIPYPAPPQTPLVEEPAMGCSIALPMPVPVPLPLP
jgi:hypothetical protein